MEWKNHPVIIAVTAGALTVAFCVTTVLPIWTKVLENRVDEYRKEIDTLKDKVKVANENVTYLEKRNKILVWDGVMGSNAPYPKGFNQVKIGDPASKVDEVFSKTDIEVKKRWTEVRVRGESEVIGRIGYYFAADSKVSHILFIFSSSDKSTPNEDKDGKLGAVGDAVLTTLKGAYPKATSNCALDDGKVECKLTTPEYSININSMSYYIGPATK